MFAWESLHSIAIGGIAAHVSELAAGLERRGHEVHVFTRHVEGQTWDDQIDGVWYHRCGFDLTANFIDECNNLCRSFVSRYEGVQRIAGYFDIVHAHDWMTSNAMVWIKEAYAVRAVMTMHSTEYGRCGNEFHGGQSELIRQHENHGTFCADRVIAVSNILKNEVSWIYHTPDWKVSVVYNGIQSANYNGFIDQGAVKMEQCGIGYLDPMVLFAGRLTVQKAPDVLLNAIPLILPHHQEAKFVFAGDGDMRTELEQRSRDLGISHACRFVGHQLSGGLQNLFRACDMVVVPSRNEPFGIVILEAWSAGKPVIATHYGGPSEFVWHNVNGLKIYPHENSVSWGICELLRNPEHGAWMGRNGRYAAEIDFSWDTIATQTEKVYNLA